MARYSGLLVIFGAFVILASNDAQFVSKKEQKITMRGRVVFPGGSNIPVEPDAKLTVELQDTSLADAPAKVIARGTGKAVRFPMAFAIRYTPSEVASGFVYSLSVTIRNKNDELLYVNDVRVLVTPLGAERTKFIDVPVILTKKTTKPGAGKVQWPELVGKNGQEAVRIIQQETGFTNVMTVKEGSMVTMDYRTDRVRVFVDSKGIVKQTPTVG